MPFRRLWLNLTRSFGTILRRGRMATVYPAGVVGRHLLSVVLEGPMSTMVAAVEKEVLLKD